MSVHSDESACFSRAIDDTNVDIIARFRVDGEPASKARARFTKSGHAYTPDATRRAEEAVAWAFRANAGAHQPDSTHEYGLACVFFAATRQRRDVDNMLKLVSDGLNGVAWADDSQVAEVTGRRGRDFPENARTEVLVYRLCEMPIPTKPCAMCGAPFRIYASNAARIKYCSPECRRRAWREARTTTCRACGKAFTKTHSHDAQTCSPECRARLDRSEATCAHCGVVFQRPKSWMAQSSVPLCGHECQVAYWAAHPTTNHRGTCADCGGPVSRREYKRCRSCGVAYRGRRVRDLTTKSVEEA